MNFSEYIIPDIKENYQNILSKKGMPNIIIDHILDYSNTNFNDIYEYERINMLVNQENLLQIDMTFMKED